ncbi:restriction endonuclease subunit S [Lactococcus garvieae]|uniref:restriction endonuclease subunit S n=1 Tax=Lactococcus garvieae TaxID=1363 RepID=UPI003D786CF0
MNSSVSSYYENNEKIEVPYDIPKSWKWVHLEQISSYIQRGKSPRYVEKSDIPIISQKSIQWSGFDLNPSRFLDSKVLEKYDEKRFIRNNDLLWCSTGTGTVGRIGIFTDKDRNGYKTIVVDSHITVIRHYESVNSRYTLAYLSSPEIQMNIDEITTGSTKQKELGLATIKNILIPICGENEQQKIIDSIYQFEKCIEKIPESV